MMAGTSLMALRRGPSVSFRHAHWRHPSLVIAASRCRELHCASHPTLFRGVTAMQAARSCGLTTLSQAGVCHRPSSVLPLTTQPAGRAGGAKPARFFLSVLAALLTVLSTGASAQTPLACGQLLNASIGVPGERDFYAFGAVAGDRVHIIALRTSGSPLNLQLFAPDGSRLQATDNWLGSDYIAIQQPVTTAGIYTVAVTANSPTGTGNYSIVWYRLNNPCGGATALACGQLVSGSLSASLEIDFYSLVASAGDRVKITALRTSSSALNLQLFDADGNRLQATDNWLGSDYIAIEQPFTTAGIYTVAVTANSPTGTGNYSVVWYRLNNPCGGATALACGQSASGSLRAPLEVDFYSFAVDAADRVKITATRVSGSALNLQLFAADGSRLQYTDNWLGWDSIAIEYTFTTAGIYTVAVTATSPTGTGNYSVGWEFAARPCQVTTFSFSVSPSSLSFSAQAGSPAAAPMQLELRSNLPGLPWQAAIRTTSGGNWLAMSVTSGQMPAAMPPIWPRAATRAVSRLRRQGPRRRLQLFRLLSWSLPQGLRASRWTRRP